MYLLWMPQFRTAEWRVLEGHDMLWNQCLRLWPATAFKNECYFDLQEGVRTIWMIPPKRWAFWWLFRLAEYPRNLTADGAPCQYRMYIDVSLLSLSCTVLLKKSYCIVYLFPEGYDCAFSDCLTESLPLLPERMVSMRFGAVEQRCIAESNKYMAIDRPWHHRSLVCLCPLASSNRCGVDMCERLPCIGMVRSLRWSKGRYICKYITYTCTCTHTWLFLKVLTHYEVTFERFFAPGPWSATICDICI